MHFRKARLIFIHRYLTDVTELRDGQINTLKIIRSYKGIICLMELTVLVRSEGIVGDWWYLFRGRTGCKNLGILAYWWWTMADPGSKNFGKRLVI